MYRIKNLLFFSVLLCLGTFSTVQGQSSKTITELGIASVTVQEYFLGEGVDKPLVESIEQFNEKGDLTEIRELNKKGRVTRWEKYTYDQEGRVIEEVFLDEKGDTVRREKTIYKGELRVEKEFYDSHGRLFKRKEYIYEYRR